MKKMSVLLGILAVVFSSASVEADTTWVEFSGPEGGAVEVNVLEASSGRTVLEFRMGGFYKDSVSIHGQPHALVKVPGTIPLLQKGLPDLGKVRESVIIPDRAHMSLRVLECEHSIISTLPVVPSKGNLTRDIDPRTVPFTFDRFYQDDGWYPAGPAALGEPYILRDFRGITIQYNPVQFCPAGPELRVNRRVVVEVVADGPGTVNLKERRREAGLYCADFRRVYERMFLNFARGDGRYTPIPEPGKMVIIADDSFSGAAEDLYQWKLQKGLDATLVNFSSIGSTAADLYAYIKNLYDTMGVTYIILVGDAEQIPTLRGTFERAHSDPCYVKLEGTDHYPDAFISRISAQSVAHVNTQVSKFIGYERNPATGAAAAWYHKGTGIASSETGGTGIKDKERADWLREDLLAYTYTQVDQIYDWGASASDVTAAVNDGRSIINYIGHGSGTSWGTTGYSVTHVGGLSNTWKLPFIVDVSCLNGSFVSRPTCLAEAWLRAGTWEAPAGAVAMFSASTSAAWVPPCVMQTEIVDLLAAEAATTVGGLFFGGSAKALDEYSDGGDGTQVMEQYNIFGDCSLVVRTNVPTAMSVQHDSMLFLGASSLSVAVPGVEGALASLYAGGVNYGAAVTDVSGLAAITIDPPLETPTDVTLTVTAFNKVPYMATVSVIPPAGPFVIYDAHAIDDSAGNGDGTVDFGETIDLAVALENVGVEPALGVAAALSTADPYTTIVDGSHTYGTIPIGGTVSSGLAYRFHVAAACPDGHAILFELAASGGGRDIWESSFTIAVQAPEVSMEAFEVDDAGGNGNGILDPGETANIIVTVVNGGAEAARDAMGTLSSADPHITILTATSSFGTVPGPGSASNETDPFVVRADAATPMSHTAEFTFDFSSHGGLYAMSDEASLMIGHPEHLILDLDGYHASGPVFKGLLEGMGKTVDYAGDFSMNFDGYRTIFVLLGVYSWWDGETRNHALGQSEALILVDFLEQGGNIYMEGGETWVFDPETALHPYFHITGVSDGYGDTKTVRGLDGTMTEGMVFNYSGHNQYMDRLSAGEGAWPILYNESPPYVNGVAYNAGTYKTIGTSFEFGGLDDGASPSTKAELLLEMMAFFSESSPCDADGDGYEAVACGGDDCDDGDPAVHPGAAEICTNGIDDDCDGLIDGADPDCAGTFTLEMDATYCDDCGGELDLYFIVGTPEPATWATYLILTYPSFQVIPLWSEALSIIVPPIDVPVSFPFPSIGWIGVYTGLFTEEGTQVEVIEWVDTSPRGPGE